MSDQMPDPADYGMYGLCPHLVCRGAANALSQTMHAAMKGETA